MKLNKRLVATLASASALALAGGAIVDQATPSAHTAKATTSAINDYIKNNGLKAKTVNYRTSTFNEDFAYDTGKPEGIVVHETATPGATAANEATYFLREWSNMGAYVHAFVDQNEIIQIHTPSRGVWGAGPVSNGKHIQVELCQVSTTADFAQSVLNDATYIANLLKTYGLKPDLATHDGSGTIWAHGDVSKYLGGTNHTDPVGYFSSWGYSMDQFFDLISGIYYGTSSQAPSLANDVAMVNYSSAIAVWNVPGGTPTGQYLQNNTKWKVSAKAEYSGKWWLKIGTNAWIPAEYTTYNNISNFPTVTTPLANNVGEINYVPGYGIAVWNTPGGKATGQYLNHGSRWVLTGKATYNGEIWFRVGSNAWIQAKYVRYNDASKIPNVTISGDNGSNSGNSSTGETASTGVVRVNYVPGYGIATWSAPGGYNTGNYLAHGTRWKFVATKQYNGETYYKVATNQWLQGKYVVVE